MGEKRFSYMKKEDWSHGLFVNTTLVNDGIGLASEIVFKEIARWDIPTEIRTTICLKTAANSLVYGTEGAGVFLYDWLAGQQEELFEMEYLKVCKLIKVCKEKAVFYSNQENCIYVHSVHSGKLILKKTLETLGEVVALDINEAFILYGLNQSCQLYQMDLKKDCVEMLHTFEAFEAQETIQLQIHNGCVYILTQKCLYGFDKNYKQIHQIEDVRCFSVHKKQLYFTQVKERETWVYGKNKVLLKYAYPIKQLELDIDGRLYVLTDQQLMIYQENRVYRKGDHSKPYTGVYYLPLIDSGESETQWSRIMVEYDIPLGTQINISYYAFDSEQLYYQENRVTLEDFFHDHTVAAKERCRVLNRYVNGEWVNPSEAVFQGARGKYLLVRVLLWGNEVQSPLLKKLRITFNEASFVEYLPEIYQTGDGRDFLERYIRIYETLYKEIEEKIDSISDYIDIDHADDRLLRWLTTWLGFEVDETWTTDKVRELLKALPELNRKRGTKNALQKLLTIYLGKPPVIIEDYKKMQIQEGHLVQSDLTPYGFTVISKLDRRLSDAEKSTIKRMLDAQTPAYTHYSFIELDDWIALDKESYLGLNSFVSDKTYLCLDSKSILPYHTLLDDDERL